MLIFKKFILNSTDILIYKFIPIWFINTSVRFFGVHIKQVTIAYIKIVRTQTRVDIFAGYAVLNYKKNYLDFKTNWLSINRFLKILTQNFLGETLLQEKVFYIESIYPPPPSGGKLLIAGFPVVVIMVENLLYNTRIGFPILQLVTNDVLTLIFLYIGTYKQSLYGV